MTKKYPEEELAKVEIRSEEINEILGKAPNWMISWGITIIAIIVLAIVTGSWFFQYPDIIKAPVIATTQNPPAPIVAKASGKINYLYVKDKESVHRGSVLAIIENPANWEDIKTAIQECKNLDTKDLKRSTLLFNNKQELILGGVHTSYTILTKYIRDYKAFLKRDFYPQKVKALKEELSLHKDKRDQQGINYELTKKEYRLQLSEFERDSILFKQSVIPIAEFEKSKSRRLTAKRNIQQEEYNLANANLQIIQIERNIFELQSEFSKQVDNYEINIIEAHKVVLSEFETWKHNYLLQAPIDGTVSFTKYWSENQAVNAGEKVLTIVPIHSGDIIGKVNLSQSGAGKVKVGDKVNLSFENYPYLEFGMVPGVIENISDVPGESGYIAEVALTKGLTTFYNEKLEFKNEMQGSAEIITEKKRLLERIIRPLRFIIKKNKANN